MPAACCDGDSACHADGFDQPRSRLHGSVAELTMIVRAPTPDGAVGKDDACVHVANRERDRIVDALDADRAEPIHGRAVVELAVLIVAPADDVPGAEQRARMPAAAL